jgi:hypothetical protein
MTENILNQVPDKFKDPESGEVKLDSLLSSYQSLEKRMSSMPSIPKSAGEYCIDCEHGLFDVDEEMNKQLHAKGFTNEQVQFVYDLAAEKMVPMIVEMANDFQADREIEKLIEHFGGEEKWIEISRQLLAFGQKNLPNDVLQSLSSSYDGVIALYNMMQGNEPSVSNEAATKNGGRETMDLQSMMRDPKYWRDKDPSFIAKVTEGFQRLYGN